VARVFCSVDTYLEKEEELIVRTWFRFKETKKEIRREIERRWAKTRGCHLLY
jgi:hypothetical protein